MRSRAIAFVLGALVLVVLPFVLSEFRTGQLATVGAYFIAILGLDILMRHGGRISLGHGAFMAIGAYTTAILVAHHGVRDLATIPVAAAVAGGIGLLVGLLTLRLSGLSPAVVTFGLALAFRTLVTRFDGLTGGSSGISFFASPHQTGGGVGVLGLTNAQWLYVLTWSIAALLFLLAWCLLGTRFGRSLRAIRDSERAAAMVGVNRSASAVAAFGVSAAYGGIAGSLFAIDIAYVTPGSIPISLSPYLLVGAVVGLYGSIWGAIAGALLVQFLGDLVALAPQVDARRPGPTTFAFGAILVVLVLARPLVARVSGVLADRSPSARR